MITTIAFHVSIDPGVLLNLVRKEAKRRFPKLTVMELTVKETYSDSSYDDIVP